MGKNIAKSMVWLGLYGIASTIGVIVAAIAYGVKLGLAQDMEFAEDLASGSMDALMKFVGDIAVPSLMIAAIICIIAFLIYKGATHRILDIATIQWDRALFSAGAGLFLNVTISVLLNLMAGFLPDSALGATDDATNIALSGSFAVVLIGTGILVPIMEEIIFRYGVHQTLARSNLTLAYIASALIFGIAHGNWIQGTYAAILGLIFAFMYTRTDNLWYPILMHMSINTSSTIISFLPDEAGGVAFLAMPIVSVAIMAILYAKRENVRMIFKSTTSKTNHCAAKAVLSDPASSISSS